MENMSLNNYQWPNERSSLKKWEGMYDIDVFSNLATQVSMLTKQLQATQLQNTQAFVNVVQLYSPSCEFCNGPQQINDCQVGNPLGKMNLEQAQYLGKFPQPQQYFNPYSNNFNPSWRNHLKFY